MKENKLSKTQIDSIKNYANNIETIENFSAAIRKTSGMYISALGNIGWLSCIREIFSNAVDQYLKPNSPCNFIEISYNEITKECTVIDNGLGIPHDIAVRVLTAQHTSSNYTKKKGEYSSGRHGVGMKVTLAFSEYFILESYVLGVGKRFEFHDGILFKESNMKSVPMYQGTKVTFKPNETKDDEHMGPISITYIDVLNLVNGILPLMPIGTPIRFTGTDLTGKSKVYDLKNNDGLLTFMIMNCDKPLIAPISFSDDTGEIKGDVMFTYDLNGMSNRETIIAYGNYSPMAEMGTHVDGFLQGIERWFCNYMNKIYLAGTGKKKSKKTLNVIPTDVRTGLVAVVSECVLKPIFKGQAKEAISNEELKPFFKELTMKALDEWSKTNPNALSKVCKYLKDVATIRVNADKEKVKISGKYNSSVFGGSLPSKYVQPTGTEDLELIIVEGDSALGSARNSRDKVHQGIFPIRGKMPNPLNTTRAKYLANAEVSAIINIIGAGYGSNFDLSKVKFKRIIIASDGDYDGYHIRTLVFKLFLYYMPQLIEAGMVYAAVPPLYGLLNNKNEVTKYFIDRLDFTNYLSKKFIKTYNITDIKGNKLSFKDVSTILYTDFEYKDEIDTLSYRYALNPLLIELVIVELVSSKNDKELLKKLKKNIKSEFRFMNIYEQDGVIVLDGVIDSESNTLALTKQFLKDMNKAIELFGKSKYSEFMLNNIPCRLYELFNTYDKFTKSQGNVVRYKGLGEMNPDELAESTIRPDGDRCLIQYTIDDVKMLSQQIRSIECDKSKLLENKNNYQISKEDLLG